MTANKGGTALTTPFADFVSKGLFSTLSGVPFSQVYLDYYEMVTAEYVHECVRFHVSGNKGTVSTPVLSEV